MNSQTAKTLYDTYNKALDGLSWFEPHVDAYIDYLRDTGRLSRAQENRDWTLDDMSDTGYVFVGDSYDYDDPQPITIPFDFFDDRTPYEEEARKLKEQTEAERRIRTRAFLESALKGAEEDVIKIKIDLTNLDNLEKDLK